MSLLNLPISNCSFKSDQDCLGEKDKWFINQILKKSGTMAETRKCIAEFNHQLEVVKRMKRRIAAKRRREVPTAIVCVSDNLPVPKGSVSTNDKGGINSS